MIDNKNFIGPVRTGSGRVNLGCYVFDCVTAVWPPYHTAGMGSQTARVRARSLRVRPR